MCNIIQLSQRKSLLPKGKDPSHFEMKWNPKYPLIIGDIDDSKLDANLELMLKQIEENPHPT